MAEFDYYKTFEEVKNVFGDKWNSVLPVIRQFTVSKNEYETNFMYENDRRIKNGESPILIGEQWFAVYMEPNDCYIRSDLYEETLKEFKINEVEYVDFDTYMKISQFEKDIRKKIHRKEVDKKINFIKTVFPGFEVEVTDDEDYRDRKYRYFMNGKLLGTKYVYEEDSEGWQSWENEIDDSAIFNTVYNIAKIMKGED